MKITSTLIVLLSLFLGDAGLHAQTCNSEVVKFKETFGTGEGRATLPAGRTNYNYNGSSTLNDGDYTLLKSSQAKPEWHHAVDHTGDVNGRMMVTNASYTPGEFYRDTVYGLSSVSTYAVSFYAMNVNTVGTCSPNPILPRLQLVIESYNSNGTFTEISSMVSNDLPQTASPTWVKISGSIYLPIDVTAIRYRIINNATGGCGNDLAIDDITFSQCAPTLLPVTGMTLKVNAGATSSATLSWTTLQERNSDKFSVEKSTDGNNWRSIATIKAAGESNSLKSYSAKDNSLSSLVVYYRITAIDFDKKSTHSNTVIIRPDISVVRMTAYPNPFASSIGLELVSEESAQVAVHLFDVHGKIIKSVPWNLRKGTNVTAVNHLDQLGKGLYFLNITDNYGKVLHKSKLMKQ